MTTTTTTTTKKLTAGNSEFLAMAKRVFNAKVFKKVAEILNAEGDAPARKYLTTFMSDPSDDNLRTFIAEHLSR